MLFLSNRDRKANYISILINSLVVTGIFFILLHPSKPIPFIMTWFIAIFVFQMHVLVFPALLKLFFFKALHPKEEQRILERKIACIKEEIKRINGEDYNEDIFHNF
jgi:hypothetical protein